MAWPRTGILCVSGAGPCAPSPNAPSPNPIHAQPPLLLLTTSLAGIVRAVAWSDQHFATNSYRHQQLRRCSPGCRPSVQHPGHIQGRPLAPSCLFVWSNLASTLAIENEACAPPQPKPCMRGSSSSPSRLRASNICRPRRRGLLRSGFVPDVSAWLPCGRPPWTSPPGKATTIARAVHTAPTSPALGAISSPHA